MISVFHPTGIIKGTVKLPSSKSISNRALIIKAISGHDFSIKDLSDSTDTETLLNLLSQKRNEYDCREGGTTFRFLLALKVLQGAECILTGSERMQQRPVKPLVDALNGLGADIHYLENDGFPPLKINAATLKGNEITIDASVSSQFISAIMMIAPSLPQGLTIHLSGEIVSHSYILLTKQIMEYFGIAISFTDNTIYIAHCQYINRDIIVEKDWSAASYWFEMAALSKETDLLLNGLSLDSMQGDCLVVDLTNEFGITVKQEIGGLRIIKSDKAATPNHFEFDFINHPDLAQTMAFLCAAKGVNGKFEGIQSLKIKETDRVVALKFVLAKFGYDLIESGNSFSLKKNNQSFNEKGALPVFNDHRMAMGLAPLSLTFGKLIIKDPDVVNKSYPGFWDQLRNVGFEVE